MIHIIKADLRHPQSMLDNNQRLGQAIVALARREGADVWFHATVTATPLGGAPCILLECSDDFLADVRALPDCKSVTAYNWGFPTQRDPNTYAFFSKPAAPPAPGMP